MLDFDEMLIQVGEFGLYQKALFLFEAPFAMFVTFVLFGQLFMTLYPNVMWCGGHFNCTFGNMSPLQRRNLSFSFTNGAMNPCFINNIDGSFIKAVVDWQNRATCGDRPCNYTHATDFVNLPLQQSPGIVFSPENIYGGGSRDGNYYNYNRGPSPQNDNGGAGGRATFNYQNFPYPTSPSWNGGNWNSAGNQWGGPRVSWPASATTTRTTFRNNNQGYYPTQYYPTATRTTSTTIMTTTTTTQIPTTTMANGNNPTPVDDSGRNSGTGSQIGNNSPLSPMWPLPFSSNRSCDAVPKQQFGQNETCCSRRLNITTRSVNITVNGMNQTIWGSIVLPEYNTVGVQFVEYRNPPYLRVEECYNITWDPVQSGVPYPTIVTEGMWWCNADTYTTAAQAVFFLGAIVGGFLIGYIADNYGRVPALVMANLLGAIGGALSVVTTNFWFFMLFRFITGMAFDNCFTMMYILVLEFCGPTYRTLVANLSIAVFYTLGTLILPWLALAVGNWRIYGLAIALPMLLGLMAVFLVPESARWLLSKGRTKEATDILRSFARVNGKNVDESVFVEFENDARKIYDEMQMDEEEGSFTAALKTPRLRRTFILLVLIWSMIALVYDGHSRNILNLANAEWNVFWMFTIASMTEFPADMLLIFTLDKFGRRWLSFGSLTMSGACSIIAAAIPQEMRTFGLVMAIFSRFFVNVAFNIGLQYAAELLPTVIRAQGVNAIHIIGYVASIISPFVAAIGRTQPAISLILLGAFAIIGGCLSLLLSETLGEDLPNTLEEAEAFGLNQSFWNCPICSKPRDDDEDMTADEPQDLEVTRRNNIRASMRGEMYRSSIISSSTSSSRGSRRRYPNVAMNPIPQEPTERTKLRRITH